MVTIKISNKRHARREQEKWEYKIIETWKARWYHELQPHSQPYKYSNEDSFAEWLVMNMELLKKGKTASKHKNFVLKFMSLFMFVLSYCFILCWNDRNSNISTLTPIISLIPSYVFAQWIRVRKYQETWSRYSRCYSLILQEMVRYNYQLPPYDKNQSNIKYFIENVLALSKENVTTFYDNMVDKENELFSLSEIKDSLT